jgi:hypothetical protein
VKIAISLIKLTGIRKIMRRILRKVTHGFTEDLGGLVLRIPDLLHLCLLALSGYFTPVF